MFPLCILYRQTAQYSLRAGYKPIQTGSFRNASVFWPAGIAFENVWTEGGLSPDPPSLRCLQQLACRKIPLVLRSLQQGSRDRMARRCLFGLLIAISIVLPVLASVGSVSGFASANQQSLPSRTAGGLQRQLLQVGSPSNVTLLVPNATAGLPSFSPITTASLAGL